MSQWLLITEDGMELNPFLLSPSLLDSPFFFETLYWNGFSFPLFEFHEERIQKALLLFHTKWEVFQKLLEVFFTEGSHLLEGKMQKVNLYLYPFSVFSKPSLLVRIAELPQISFRQLRFVPHLYTVSVYFSQLKSVQCQIYLVWRKHLGKDATEDLMLLSHDQSIAETTIANIWWDDGDSIWTPPLSSGCVNGVCRKALLSFLNRQGYPVGEKPFLLRDLSKTRLIWLTNALRGIQVISQIVHEGQILWKMEGSTDATLNVLSDFQERYFGKRHIS
jgi:branched-subunit amino acid aminotransferase/4-amino-4-deoxychorismate lyase